MTYEPTTNFKDSNGVDLGKKLVTKDYLLEVYGEILNSIGNSGLTVSPALWTWGENQDGQLGINATTDRSTPVTTFAGGINWEQVSNSAATTAAIKTDGTLWIWGLNTPDGGLGINNAVNKSTPVTTFAGGNDWKQVSCGKEHTAAIKTDGTLWTWGSNFFGQLGINNVAARNTPVTTFSGQTNWKFLGAGQFHTAAIKTDGTLWVWGRNGVGQLGINNLANRSVPVTTFAGGTNWKFVSGGLNHTAGIKTDGTLWIWGLNSLGQLGINNTITRSTPITTFAGGTNWKFVSAGYLTHTLAIKTDGTLWGWGDNDNCELGINNAISKSTPVTTFAGGTNWKFVSGGGNSSSAIKTDGTLWVWGFNDAGQLADNTNTIRSTPVTTFLGGNDWKSVSSKGFSSVAIQSVDYI